MDLTVILDDMTLIKTLVKIMAFYCNPSLTSCNKVLFRILRYLSLYARTYILEREWKNESYLTFSSWRDHKWIITEKIDDIAKASFFWHCSLDCSLTLFPLGFLRLGTLGEGQNNPHLSKSSIMVLRCWNWCKN